jgi:hypothetical protein
VPIKSGLTIFYKGIAKNVPIIMPNCKIRPQRTPAYFLTELGAFSKAKINDPSKLMIIYL